MWLFIAILIIAAPVKSILKISPSFQVRKSFIVTSLLPEVKPFTAFSDLSSFGPKSQQRLHLLDEGDGRTGVGPSYSVDMQRLYSQRNRFRA
jgi:hypothetical protein